MTIRNVIFGSLTAYMLIALPSNLFAVEMDEIHKGTELFKTYCSACHGEKAIGQDPNQPAGGWDAEEKRLAPALNGTGHAWHHPPKLLFEYIQKGSIDKTSPMPSFEAVLNDDQIEEIITYIYSLWPDKIRTLYKKRFTENKE